MDAGEPLSYYLLKRLKVLFKRRYSPAWREFNVFLDGASISKRQTPTKAPVHFEAWLIDPTDRVKPLWGGPVEKQDHWGVFFCFRHYGPPRVEKKGRVIVVGHLVRIESNSWTGRGLATAGCDDSCSYELADPDCIELVVAKFKLMFPTK